MEIFESEIEGHVVIMNGDCDSDGLIDGNCDGLGAVGGVGGQEEGGGGEGGFVERGGLKREGSWGLAVLAQGKGLSLVCARSGLAPLWGLACATAASARTAAAAARGMVVSRIFFGGGIV